MADKTRVEVYRYGCPSWFDLPATFLDQIRLATELRWALVDIENTWQAFSDAADATFPEIAAAQQVVARAQVDLAGLDEEIKRDRIENRTTAPLDRLAARHGEAKATLRTAWTDLRAVRRRLNADRKARRAEWGVDEAKRDALLAQGGLYADFVQARGLGWGTYNAVSRQHKVDVAATIGKRAKGAPAKMPRPRSRTEGTLTVQQQAGQGSVWFLAPGRPGAEWRGVPVRREAALNDRHRTLRLRVGRGRGLGTLWLEMPLVLDRPLPDDAVVKQVQVTRRLIAGSPRLSVQFTLELPAAEPKSTGRPTVVGIGWESVGSTEVDDHTVPHIRVARITAATGELPPVPADVAHLVLVGEEYADVHADPSWLALNGRDDGIRSVRDELLDELRPLVVDALTDPLLVEAVGVDATTVGRWRAQRRFVPLARTWPADHPLAGKLTAWSKRDWHLWQYETHERDQVAARRRDAWRKVAAWICEAASMIQLDRWSIASVRRTAPLGEHDTYQARHARRNAQVAAPGELRAAIRQAASKRGIKVVSAHPDPDPEEEL